MSGFDVVGQSREVFLDIVQKGAQDGNTVGVDSDGRLYVQENPKEGEGLKGVFKSINRYLNSDKLQRSFRKNVFDITDKGSKLSDQEVKVFSKLSHRLMKDKGLDYAARLEIEGVYYHVIAYNAGFEN